MLYEKWERQQGAMLIIYWMPNTITLNTGPDNQIQVSEGEVKESPVDHMEASQFPAHLSLEEGRAGKTSWAVINTTQHRNTPKL